jgi:DNA-binding transcriptional regulator LsrR (DeoR family)
MEKFEEIKRAKKRRAKLLAEFTRLGWTQTKFAAKHKLTRSRIGQMLKQAKEEAKDE